MMFNVDSIFATASQVAHLTFPFAWCAGPMLMGSDGQLSQMAGAAAADGGAAPQLRTITMAELQAMQSAGVPGLEMLAAPRQPVIGLY